MQLPDFMAYLNPTSVRVEEREVLTGAKFAAWAFEDEAMRETTVRVSVGIMKRKIKARAQTFGLIGKRPELAIWVSDIFHQGRGKTSLIHAALAKPTFSQQLETLSRIDTTSQYTPRLDSVRSSVGILMEENRFAGVNFGKGALAFD